MKATEQYFSLMLFIMLHEVVLTFESWNESYWAVLFFNAVYYVAWGGSNFWVLKWKLLSSTFLHGTVYYAVQGCPKFESVDEILSVTIQMKAAEQYFPVTAVCYAEQRCCNFESWEHYMFFLLVLFVILGKVKFWVCMTIQISKWNHRLWLFNHGVGHHYNTCKYYFMTLTHVPPSTFLTKFLLYQPVDMQAITCSYFEWLSAICTALIGIWP